MKRKQPIDPRVSRLLDGIGGIDETYLREAMEPAETVVIRPVRKGFSRFALPIAAALLALVLVGGGILGGGAFLIHHIVSGVGFAGAPKSERSDGMYHSGGKATDGSRSEAETRQGTRADVPERTENADPGYPDSQTSAPGQPKLEASSELNFLLMFEAKWAREETPENALAAASDGSAHLLWQVRGNVRISDALDPATATTLRKEIGKGRVLKSGEEVYSVGVPVWLVLSDGSVFAVYRPNDRSIPDCGGDAERIPTDRLVELLGEILAP